MIIYIVQDEADRPEVEEVDMQTEKEEVCYLPPPSQTSKEE